MPLSCSNRRNARPGALAIVLLAACGLSTLSPGARAAGLTTTLRWYAPFLSGGGYSSEALSYVLALARDPGMDSKLWIEQHGDAPNHEVIQGAPQGPVNHCIEYSLYGISAWVANVIHMNNCRHPL